MRTCRPQMENMLRLIVFGCSQTYGHCLPDAYVEDKSTWDKIGIAPAPSKLAFAQHVGDYLGRTVHNLSWPGGSNRNMWYEAVHFEYAPTDIVVCAWTMPDRSMIIQKQEKQHLGTWPSVDALNKAYQRFTALSNSLKDSDLTALHLIDHTHKVVAPQVANILHYKQTKMHYVDIPKWASFKFQNSLDSMVPYDKMDYALDNAHYGVESHKSIARQMIQDLTIGAN